MAGLGLAVGGIYLALSNDLRPLSHRDHQANLQAHPTQPGKLVGENDENMRSHRITKGDDPSAPGAGRPDQDIGLRGHSPKDSSKAMNPGAISPDVADPVRSKNLFSPLLLPMLSTNSPILVESPGASTTCLESRRVFPMATLTIALKSPSSQG